MGKNDCIEFFGILGRCGALETFLGFSAADELCEVSSPDVLDEDRGTGYQRPHSAAHSRRFREYIEQPNASTIPLTLNARADHAEHWAVTRHRAGTATLRVERGYKSLAQVDCQHRLGDLASNPIPLAFMAFLGLDLRTEMALFNVINAKAKGLSSSLTDYHESTLLADLAGEAPHLFIARRLNEDGESPWFRLIRYGGENSSGLKRRTSLRMMQQSVRKFLARASGHAPEDVEDRYRLVRDYWIAVRRVFPREWDDHRHHLITKGVGLYSLMYLLADLVKVRGMGTASSADFAVALEPLKRTIDWDSGGPFSHAGGQKGALEVYEQLRVEADL